MWQKMTSKRRTRDAVERGNGDGSEREGKRRKEVGRRSISLEARKAVLYRTKQKAQHGYHCADSLGYNGRAVRGGLVSFLLPSS